MAKAYRVVGDEQNLHIGDGELLQLGEHVHNVYAHRSYEKAVKILDYLNDRAFEYDGGGSWAQIMEIEVESSHPGKSHKKAIRLDLDDGQIIVSGIVTRIYENN